MASSSSSATAQVTKKYDVFISFRGEETRTTITGFLYGRLHWEYHINVFMDDQLKKGEEISPSLRNTIEDSNISVIIFSESYASSRWCLEELVKIMECKKAYRQIVLPVFFCVDPSHIRNQTDTFGDGFARLVKSFNKEKLEKLQMSEEQFQHKVQAWRNAMTEAANLCGYTATRTTSLYGITLKIARDILEMLNYLSSQVDNNDLIAIEPNIDYIIKYLLGLNYQQRVRNHKNEIEIWGLGAVSQTIGIWGMGGVGKTTIAEAVYNKVWPNFKASYFALNVREKSSNQNTLTLLRQELLSTLLNNWHSNMPLTYNKRSLGSQKVLIVFDDITCFSQIEFLIGDLNCLGQGSCIIITTRNKQVLRNCGVQERYVYKIEGLSHCGALQLFSRHAFGQNHPKMEYDELSDRVVQYAKGIPLALKVLGSFLFDKSKEVWESAITKLEIIPHEDIQKVLKVSYDGLDDIEKNIFLDIACFLKWENKDFAIEFLDACGFYAKLGISVLIDKCLITISNDNKMTMHDLLQEMGWEIVRQESTRDPGERSRLWYHEDINSVLEENTGTKAIEGICLDMSKQKEIIYLQPSALALMRRLRFFKLHNPEYEENNINKVHASEDLNSISTELRYLCWHGCPLKSLQSNFRSRNLIALDMPHSSIEQLYPGVQLHKLKHIDLSYSKNLRIHDLSLAPNLESLILEGCTNLFKISSSIQCLNKLVILDLSHCKNVCSLPVGIRLESLKKAILSCCSKFKIFDPEISSNIEELFLDETAIEELPTSIENLSKLVRLNLKNCAMLDNLPSNIGKLKCLEHLILSGCSKLDGLPDNIGNLEALKVLQAERIGKMVVPSSIVHLRRLMKLNLSNCCIKELPNYLGQLSSLESLLLGRNFFESIPTSIINLSKLSYLDLSFCERLKSLPKLPQALESIDAHNCTSLEELSDLPQLLCNLQSLDAHGWTAQEALSSLSTRYPKRYVRVNFINCFRMDQNVLEEIVQDAMLEIHPNRMPMWIRSEKFLPQQSACICFSGIEFPNWFNFQSEGSSVTLLRPSVPYGSNICGFAVCAIVEFRNYHNDGQGLVVGYDYKFSYGRNNWSEVLQRGALRVWDYGTGPEFVDSHHVFLGFDFLLQSQQIIFYHGTAGRTIQFYVEDLNAKRIACCNVKKCGAYFIYEGERTPIEPIDEKVEKEKEKEKEKEETHTKRLKISNSFKGESSSSY